MHRCTARAPGTPVGPCAAGRGAPLFDGVRRRALHRRPPGRPVTVGAMTILSVETATEATLDLLDSRRGADPPQRRARGGAGLGNLREGRRPQAWRAGPALRLASTATRRARLPIRPWIRPRPVSPGRRAGPLPGGGRGDPDADAPRRRPAGVLAGDRRGAGPGCCSKT